MTTGMNSAGTSGAGESPPAGHLRFGDLRTTSPISRDFGYDRGQPIDRYYIERFLIDHARNIRGRVLEVGDDKYSRRFGRDHVMFRDILNVREGVPGTTIVDDLTQPKSIPAGTFDCIILTQTLQLIYDVPAAIRTLHRALKPGGVLLATFPGISQVVRDEWTNTWYWGFTTDSTHQLFAEVFLPDDLVIKSYGNVLAAISFLHGIAAEELTAEELDTHDPQYELLIAITAAKATGNAINFGDYERSSA